MLLFAAVSGCGQSGVTPPKLEKVFAPTFANLISAQQPMLGLPVTDPKVFGASASCHRLGPGKDPTGSGDWVCTVTWSIPSRTACSRNSGEVSTRILTSGGSR